MVSTTLNIHLSCFATPLQPPNNIYLVVPIGSKQIFYNNTSCNNRSGIYSNPHSNGISESCHLCSLKFSIKISHLYCSINNIVKMGIVLTGQALDKDKIISLVLNFFNVILYYDAAK